MSNTPEPRIVPRGTRFQVYLGRRRPVVDTLAEAQTLARNWIEGRELRGRNWNTLLTEDDRVTMMEVWEWCQSHGIDNHQIVPLLEKSRAGSLSPAIGDVVSEFIAAKESGGRSEEYVRQRLRKPLAQFLKGAMAARPLNSITPAECEAWVSAEGLSDSTKSSRHGTLSMFFTFAIRRGHIDRSPLMSVDKPRVRRGVVDIYSNDECRRWLASCLCVCPDLLPSLVLMMFAGLRPGEVQHMRWDRVNLDQATVDVRLETSKGRARRIVTLEPVAVEWLKTCKASELQLPYLGDWSHARSVLKSHSRLAWGQDWFRHTAATHLYNLHGPVETCRRLGHSEAMLHAHYRDAVSRDHSTAFWQELGPVQELEPSYLNRPKNIIKLNAA